MIKRKVGAALALAALVTAWLPGPVGAEDPPPAEIVAEELDVPRGMDIGADGALYIAEGGEGGDECDEETGTCIGFTGAITRVAADGSQSRVLTGLPSLSRGLEVVGPSDVSVGGGRGYHMVASDGGVFTLGDALFVGSAGNLVLNSPIVDMADHPSGIGYWLFASDGGVFTYGLAGFFGSAGAIKLNKPIVGGFATPSGKGYVLVASDGGIFTYGDATFHGSTGAMTLNQPIVAAVPTPTGKGYYLIASDGGVFTFGDAVFRGSTGNIKLNKPIVNVITTESGKGYILVANDGGVFTFGDAVFRGSTGAMTLNQPINAIIPTPTGNGYWLIASDGGVFSFGDAAFFGSLGNIKLNKPIVGASVTPLSIAFTIGYGGHPDDRQDELGDAAALFAIAGLSTGGNTWIPIADLGAFEKANNPDGKEDGPGGPGVDTNPYAILLDQAFALAVDAGGNSVVRAGLAGMTLGTTLPPVIQTLPPDDGGGEYPSDAVPTSIVKGPDGAFYLGQLTGYPFTEGAASVWRWVPGSAPTKFREGFTTIADIGFTPNGNLYVSELRFEFPDVFAPNGQIVEVTPGNVRRVVAKGFVMPTGLRAAGNDAVYVTNCGICTDAGHVIRFDPTKAPEGGFDFSPPEEV
jgi:hypothetical protein